MTDTVQLLGNAILELWPDLPRGIQETVFETAVGGNEERRHALAIELHDRHPRTEHPAKPTAIA